MSRPRCLHGRPGCHLEPDTAAQYGSTVSDAGRATGEDVWLAPMINAVNFVTGGRNFETLGEDPYLAGQLVASEVQVSRTRE